MAERNRRTVRDLRRGNRARVLQRLYFDGPLSRQELGPATGLSSGSISNVVAELSAEGLLQEAGIVDSDGGRPRTLLRVAPDGGLLVGIDIGETRVRVELFDLSLTELARTERLLAQHGYDVDRIVAHVRTGVADVLRDAGADPHRLLGIGIGVPGIIEREGPEGPDGKRTAVVHGQTIGWHAVPFEQLLREAVDVPPEVPLFIDNGAKTLGRAEMWFGGGRGAGAAAIALIGSGVGACVDHGDILAEDRTSLALEWGHTTVQLRGRRCRCGSIGCLEAYAGAEALRERWREAGGPLPEDADDETALAALLAAAYPPPGGPAPDRIALSLLDETAECLGAALADLVNLFLPERILLGGWAGLLLGPHLLPEIRRYANEYALRHAAARTTIEMGRLGPDAVTVGAATLPLADFLTRGGSRPAPGPRPEGTGAPSRTATEAVRNRHRTRAS
ncbi:ROK family protein [Streptomyces microflavus]|uniref:ROK family transcriptional regulator n=1 Tax=Streptomyces TaxID=1883 RepID=UPI00082387DE|nr:MULTISPECIES: ROK family transcriptional regulator [Streptomyces]MCX4656628.1 ROK family transcriptional regulator [Streptomyces microflavus]MDX2978420.1 ROK family transcriptional regulator [Streptomyces sp. NRRL_B-2249]WSS32666.1 ROK family transcriptional regulator [Streptomyces microflavus]WST18801.1 ROK family transcriptional regulator [Streptomyces microflavus]SCK14180.1 Sugar kinase of the NBD/HSP70 family, may contain an N-terminal HTH domain [Streptomyces sp. ScaeMP-e48]